jgi:hypothetical protein
LKKKILTMRKNWWWLRRRRQKRRQRWRQRLRKRSGVGAKDVLGVMEMCPASIRIVHSSES